MKVESQRCTPTEPYQCRFYYRFSFLKRPSTPYPYPYHCFKATTLMLRWVPFSSSPYPSLFLSSSLFTLYLWLIQNSSEGNCLVDAFFFKKGRRYSSSEPEYNSAIRERKALGINTRGLNSFQKDIVGILESFEEGDAALVMIL